MKRPHLYLKVVVYILCIKKKILLCILRLVLKVDISLEKWTFGSETCFSFWQRNLENLEHPTV